MKKLILCALISVFLCSCVVTTTLSQGEESYVSDTDIKATDFFSGILEDLSSFQRDPNGKSFMELSVDSFTEQLSASALAYDIEKSGQYKIRFSFEDFNKLLKYLSQSESQSIITITDNSLVLNISMDNYDELKKIVPFLAQKDIEVYCAEYNTDYSEEDYLTMMEYIAGPESREGILSSYVSLTFNTPSGIKSTNGIKTSENSVVFTFKLIDFLLLKDPIYFFCEF